MSAEQDVDPEVRWEVLDEAPEPGGRAMVEVSTCPDGRDELIVTWVSGRMERITPDEREECFTDPWYVDPWYCDYCGEPEGTS